MIVVLGRPRVHRPEPDGGLVPGGLAADIALTVGAAGETVEIVGSIGDDPEGDHVVVELGRAGVGHAALLRDPAARTPVVGAHAGDRPMPQLDAADIELGLRYVSDCRVLIIAARLSPEARAAALEAAAYHSASVIMVAEPGSIDPAELGDSVTLLERPRAEECEEGIVVATTEPDDAAFAAFITAYALRLARGEAPSQAFEAALVEGAWEASPD
jgi:hypothetical protein